MMNLEEPAANNHLVGRDHVRSRQICRELQIALLSDPFMRLIDALDPVDRIADVALGYRHAFADFILPGRRRSQHPG